MPNFIADSVQTQFHIPNLIQKPSHIPMSKLHTSVFILTKRS